MLAAGLLAAAPGDAEPEGAPGRASAPTTLGSEGGAYAPSRCRDDAVTRARAGTARAGALPTDGGGSMRPATRSSSLPATDGAAAFNQASTCSRNCAVRALTVLWKPVSVSSR